MRKISVWLVVLLVGAGLVLAGCGRKNKSKEEAPSIFSVDTKDDGKVVVKAENAGKGSAATGHMTLEEGQQMRVIADFSKGSVKVKFFLEDDSKEPVEERIYDAIDAEYVELPAGEYILEISAKKGATGTLEIEPGGNATAGSGS